MVQFNQCADDQLVNLYLGGDNAAFDALLNRHQANVFAYILHMVKDLELANDLFQETFVKAIVNLKHRRYTCDGKFPAWVNRIAHNLVIDYYRQEKSLSTVSTDDADMNLLNRKDLAEGTIEDAMIDEQMCNDVRCLIDTLPPDQQAVVRMRYYEDLSFKEIAERTGVSINTALGRMRYAILNMRKRFKESDMALA